MKRKLNICIYILIWIVSLVTFITPFGSGDELWNYTFARCISNGMLPYRDFNMVQTPLSAVFPAILMKFFGEELIVYRIAGYILFALIACQFYYYFYNSCADWTIRFDGMVFSLSILLIYYLYNYNNVQILIILSIILLERSDKKNKDLWIGIFAGISIVIKQNTGFFIMLANFLICGMYIIKSENKKRYLYRAAVSLIPGSLFLIYLLISGTIRDFMEYAVWGVKTFTHRFTPIDLWNQSIVYGVWFVIFVIGYVRTLWDLIKRKMPLQESAEFLFSLAGVSVIYPLCDASHLLCAVVTQVPVCFKSLKKLKAHERMLCVAVGGCILYLMFLIKQSDMEGLKTYDIKNYRYIPMKEEYVQSLDIMKPYIIDKVNAGYKIHIADDSAVFYYAALDIYEKNWSMLLVGNIGLNSVEDLLNEDGDKHLYLVRKEEPVMKQQNHFELFRYIKKNYKKIDEVLCFEVYKKEY